MNAPASSPQARAYAFGVGAVLGSLIAQNAGAAFAKLLFPLIGPLGVTAVRIAFAAALLMVIRRPWRRPVPRDLLLPLLGFGAVLGLMNVFIYQAFARLPIGIATAIEVTGPLAIVLIGSRRPLDFLWLLLAVLGLFLLLPLRADPLLDPTGIAFAVGAAACWAFYIVFGSRVSAQLQGDAVAWGMVVGSVIALPLGLWQAGGALFVPMVAAIGLAVAFLSSAVPYSLEMEAMRRLPARVFGLLLSGYPAVAALAGLVILGEMLMAIQWLAIACIVAASGGAAISAARSRT